MTNCIFCKIINKEIPSSCVYEDSNVFAFMDIAPVSKDHILVVPKVHTAKLNEMSDESLTKTILAVKKIATSLGAENYNILQNNGRLAGQAVDHVHFHIIPRGVNETMDIDWKLYNPQPSMEALAHRATEISKNLK